MPKITVIMPVYNGARYLDAAIDSVVSQAFTDWELVVVDDGSTDATPQILDEHTDCRIIKIRQDNAGEARVRNVGLDHATGQYIAFLDADDLYLPDALEGLSEFLDLHPEYDAVFSDGYTCDEHGRALTRLSDHRLDVYTGNVLEPLVLSNVIAAVICTMTRRSTIECHGVRFDENLVIGPDWDFWIQLARHARFGYLDKLTCMYRVHHTNITRTSGLQKRKDDLVRGRMKVLNSDWFHGLSTTTRRQFFYNLLIGLLAGERTKQEAILDSEQFRRLPPHDQAELWRHIAVDCLLRRSEQNFGVNCLQEAVRIWPSDRKSRYLLWTLRWGSLVPFNFLRLWRVVHSTIDGLRSLGQRRPKPVPAELGPVGD